MKTFEISHNLVVDCETKFNKAGLKHVAKLKRDGKTIANASVQWSNRSWESFTYQVALQRVLKKATCSMADYEADKLYRMSRDN